MSQIRKVTIRPLRSKSDRVWAARLMASSEPWITLRRTYATATKSLTNPKKEYHLISHRGERAGFLILDLNGPLGGYIQTIALAPEFRGRGLGTAALRWAERRIFQEHRNVLLCVSSFNRRAQQLYKRLGYETVGRMRDYVVAGHDEILLRKTLGPLTQTSSTPRKQRPRRKSP